MDVRRRTLDALDWPFILENLAACARTELGAGAARCLEPLADRAVVAELLDAVEEVARIRDAEGHPLWLAAITDVVPALERAGRKQVLEAAELCAVRDTAAAMADLGALLARHGETAPTLARWAERIDVDRELRRTLDRAFDERGALSERTYPRLGELRGRIATLERRVRSTLERLLAGGELADVLQDPYITVRADRLVIPLKVHARRFEIGIVHDSSRSGQTVYVEPHQVVPLNNEMRVIEAELAAEERRILAELSDLVGRHAGTLSLALEATIDVDLAQARAELAVRLNATRPARSRGLRLPAISPQRADRGGSGSPPSLPSVQEAWPQRVPTRRGERKHRLKRLSTNDTWNLDFTGYSDVSLIVFSKWGREVFIDRATATRPSRCRSSTNSCAESCRATIGESRRRPAPARRAPHAPSFAQRAEATRLLPPR